MSLVAILAFSFVVRLNLMGTQSAQMSPNLGVRENKLSPCPDKPNCVVSFYSSDKEHYIEPMDTTLSIQEVKDKLLKKQEFKVEKIESNYIHLTYESKLFGFIDDIEILKINNTLYFRSASRVGYSDLGANRKRVLQIKEILNG